MSGRSQFRPDKGSRFDVHAAVVRPRELGPAELTLWRELRAGLPELRSGFLAPEYALAVDRHREGVRVAVLSDAGETVGFFAFEQRRGTAKPVGHGLTDTEAIVHAAGWTPDPRAMLRACGLDGWDFETLVEEQVPAGAEGIERRAAPIMDISGGFEAYLDNRRAHSKKLVQATQRKQRKLEREVGELRFVFDEQDPKALQQLMDWKSGQYRQLQEWDRFADERIVSLVRELHATKEPECSGTLSVLYVADVPMAAHFGLASPATLATWFPAYDPEHSSFSPGILLHFFMAEAAAERGIGELNLGRGHHEYKEQLKTGDLTVVRGALDAGSVGPKALARRVGRLPRKYLRPWLKQHPKLEHAIAVRLSRRTAG
jgi:CelD/BcsL family acetyltransferase involved in cellulose biosynthesis